MTLKQTLATLKKEGTAQNRKIYGRHGVTGDMFGVSYANLKKLAKQCGTDTGLARGLWATGNHDARILATMVADPGDYKSAELDAMARDLGCYVDTGAFSGLVARSPHGLAKFKKWRDRKNEWIATAAWDVLSSLALDMGHPTELDDAWCAEQIRIISEQIHQRPNRVRHAMNQALIAMGVRNAKLTKKALAAAKKVGKVEVDHGQTSCKTPDAAAYIAKTLTHRSKPKAVCG